MSHVGTKNRRECTRKRLFFCPYTANEKECAGAGKPDACAFLCVDSNEGGVRTFEAEPAASII